MVGGLRRHQNDMAICDIHYQCDALGKTAGARVILPEPGAVGPFPVFYLLHGHGDDHTMWTRRTNLERYAAQWPLIVVMPDGGRGFYCDAVVGFDYEKALHQLISYVDATFQTRAERGGRCIGGLSMGGYGALHLALKHPQLFVSANSHSGALGFGHDELTGGGWQEFAQRIVGKNPRGSDYDLYALADRLAQSDASTRPQLRIDCGTEDFLLDQNRAFHAHLKSLDIAHQYQEFPGEHNWDYWDDHIREALTFHAKALGL